MKSYLLIFVIFSALLIVCKCMNNFEFFENEAMTSGGGMTDAEFELNQQDENLETNHANFSNKFRITPQHNWDNEEFKRRSDLDGNRYDIPGYYLIYCYKDTHSVLPHYFVNINPDNNLTCRPGQRITTVPGYILTCRRQPDIPPVCPDCPTLPDRDMYELMDGWKDGNALYKGNGWEFGKVDCSSDTPLGDCDNCDRWSSDKWNKTKICCYGNKNTDSDKYLCKGKWKADTDDPFNLISVNINDNLILETKKNHLDNSLYNTIEYQTDKFYTNGLFIIDVKKIPDSSLWMPKLLLKREYDIINKNQNKNFEEINILKSVNLQKPYGFFQASSLFTPDDKTCVQSNTTTNNCSELGGCNVIVKDSTIENINKKEGGVFACDFDHSGKIKMWFIPYTQGRITTNNNSGMYENAISNSPHPTNWGEPYVIFEPCANSFKDGLKLSITTEFNKDNNVIEKNKDEDEKIEWEIRSVKIFNKKIQAI